MKPLFDKTDKIEKFQKAINYEAKLLCNVDEAFTREKAADLLQRLVRSWQMDEYDVTMTTIQSVQDTIDKRLRGYVLRFMDLEKIPYSEQEIKQRWETLTSQEKNEVIDGIINHMNEHRKQN